MRDEHGKMGKYRDDDDDERVKHGQRVTVIVRGHVDFVNDHMC